MKALVLEEYKKLVYKDVMDPEIRPDEVLVRIKACGICGSDVHGFDGSTGRRIPPVIMGHEASGTIETTGQAVKKWHKGDRVTFDSTVYPLDDWFTLEGRYNLSDNREVLGVSPGEYRRNGAFAEFLSVPQHILYRIPDSVTFEQAAMVEAAAVALHSINVAQMKAGDSCVVTGAGMIGTFLIKLLRIAGAGIIIAIDIDSGKLASAKEAGADKVFNASEKNIEEKIKALTNSRGSDISFEAAGKNETVNTAIAAARKGGTVVLIGNTSKTIELPLQKIVTGELKILGSCAIRGEYEIILKLLEDKRLNVDDQISAIAPLSEGADWFRKLYNKEGNLRKVILIP
ncbi:MAG TPA: galactitol-1-phosphate 5-dehydrogenase [Bacteroidales bacterium]|nr:galactitol-1-phosphate 5-dehydrogenase [Bacteroidales bacterium]HBZ20634.1 galactitol-1-phosphate 5-dehydrogenase [Bacteroidales bacterium]